MRDNPLPCIEGHPQVFLDDTVVAQLNGLRKTVHPPVKAGQVILGDVPWEETKMNYACPVLVDGRIRVYYLAYGPCWLQTGEPPEGFSLQGSICVAESDDGINFSRPALTYFTPAGHEQTNIVFAWWEDEKLNAIGGVGVSDDPTDPDPARRFKMLYNRGNTSTMQPKTTTEGPSLAFSPDGLQWAPYAGNPLVNTFNSDTQQCLVRDPVSGTWIALIRMWEREAARDGRRVWKHYGNNIRAVGRMESTDFENWSEPEIVLTREPEDPELCDFYGLQAVMHHGMLLGFLWTADWDEETAETVPGKHGRMRAQLVVSRDLGRSWTRVDRHSMFLGLGSEGSFDAGQVYPGPMLTLGDTHYIYYSACCTGHGAGKLGGVYPPNAWSIGLATLSRDRFVSLDGGVAPGVLQTQPLVAEAGTLTINANTQPGGRVTVAVETAEGRLIPGLGRSRPFTGNDLRAVITWPDGALHEHVGKSIRFRFTLHRASLFSFSCR